MKKKKVGVVASSVAAIAVCTSVIAGSTYALFTSEDKVNVAVTSGTVNVTASLVENSLKTYSLGVEQAGGTFENGGFASVENGTVTLGNITPGDRAEFSLQVVNNSNVNIKYRTVIASEEGENNLLDALEVTVDEVTFNGAEIFTTWAETSVKGEVAVVNVSVELPYLDESQNGFQSASCHFGYSLEAVQGNANVHDFFEVTNTVTDGDDVTTTVKGYASLSEAFKNVADGGTVDIRTDCTLKEGVQTLSKDVTLNGHNHTVNLQLGMEQQNRNIGFIFGGKTIDAESGEEKSYSAGNTVINDLTVVGHGFVGIELEGFNGGLCDLNNVTISGEYTHTALNFYSSNGGTLNGCDISNGIADSKAVYSSYNAYGTSYGAVSVFANRAYRYPVNINNSRVQTVLINNSKDDNILNTKVFVNESSTVDLIALDQMNAENTNGADGTFADCYAVNGGTLNYAVDWGKKLPLSLYGETKGAYLIGNAYYMQLFASRVNSGMSFAGETVKLIDDIDLAGIDWTPIGTNPWAENGRFAGVFDGANHTISNLTVDIKEDGHSAGLFAGVSGEVKNLTVTDAKVNNISTGEHGTAVLAGVVYPGGKVTDVTVIGSTVNCHRRAAGIAGYFYGTISGCKVIDCHIVATPNVSGNSFDNGDKVGGIAGFMGGDSGNLYNCSVINTTLIGYRDVGGVVGIIYKNSHLTFKNNIVEGGEVKLDATLQYGDESKNVGALIGRFMDGLTIEDIDESNKANNVSVKG